MTQPGILHRLKQGAAGPTLQIRGLEEEIEMEMMEVVDIREVLLGMGLQISQIKSASIVMKRGIFRVSVLRKMKEEAEVEAVMMVAATEIGVADQISSDVMEVPTVHLGLLPASDAKKKVTLLVIAKKKIPVHPIQEEVIVVAAIAVVATVVVDNILTGTAQQLEKTSTDTVALQLSSKEMVEVGSNIKEGPDTIMKMALLVDMKIAADEVVMAMIIKIAEAVDTKVALETTIETAPETEVISQTTSRGLMEVSLAPITINEEKILFKAAVAAEELAEVILTSHDHEHASNAGKKATSQENVPSKTKIHVGAPLRDSTIDIHPILTMMQLMAKEEVMEEGKEEIEKILAGEPEVALVEDLASDQMTGKRGRKVLAWILLGNRLREGQIIPFSNRIKCEDVSKE